MRKIFTLFAALMLTTFSFAQLIPDGSTAPDFSLYEINKTNGTMITSQTINLYSMLNDYKTVYIDISASTCGPCYNFHNTGTLENLYASYGPNSTANDSRVLVIEGAQTGNSWASLTGQLSNTWDMTDGAEYPLIPLYISPNTSNASTFLGSYYESTISFPTVFMVCPNRMLYKLYGAVSSNATVYHNQIATKCPAFNNTNDALLGLENCMDRMYFCDHGVTPKVLLQNVGTATLTSATLRITMGNEVQTRDWSGSLAQFESAVISLSPITPSQNGIQDITFEIIKANGVNDEGSKYNTHTETISVQMSSDIATASQNFTSSNLSPWFLDDHTGGGCTRHLGTLRFKAWSIQAGGTADFYAPLMNFTNNAAPSLSFDVAHRRFQERNEKLEVMVSSDCGESWTTVYNKQGEELATEPAGSEEEFNVNNSTVYRTETVDLSTYAGNEHVLIKFVFTSGYGNNVFIDNVKITNGATAVESIDNNNLTIFPNPVKDVLTINYDKAISQIDVYDVNGKLVKSFTTVGNSINISGLSKGIYMLNMQTEDGLIVKSIVKE